MRLAVYAGTFDPITCGHLSVVRRARGMFDRLIVLVAVNPEKQPLFSLDDRLSMIREATDGLGVECTPTTDYVVTFARSVGAQYLVRGVRGATDIEGEISLARMNYQLASEIETVFIPAEPRLSEVSSSRLKELASRGEDISAFCPPAVERHLRERLGLPATQEAIHV